MSTLAVIPARGGSKELPRKNLAPFMGKRLIEWTIEAANLAQEIDRVMISTDDEEIARVSQRARAEFHSYRPAWLAEDGVHSLHSVLYSYKELRAKEGYEPEHLFMLLPTSPLRTSRDIDNAVKMLKNCNALSVVSVTEAPPLHSLRLMKRERLEMALPEAGLQPQRQEVPKTYAVNGSIFGAVTNALDAHKTFHMEDAVPYLMPKERSVDINSLEDLELAKKLA